MASFSFGAFVFVITICAIGCNDTGKRLSRQRRYLTFPKGSSLQLVFDGAAPVVDYTYYAVIGITAAISWELPHRPFFFDDEFANTLNNGLLTHRQDVDANVNLVQDIYYFGENNNLLQDNAGDSGVEYYDKNKTETYEWNKLMSNADPDLILTDNFPFIRKQAVVPMPLGKRSVDEIVENELFQKYHSRSRYDLYRLVEKYLDSNGVDGSHCLQRILCEVGLKKTESNVLTFVEELLKDIFHLAATDPSTLSSPQTIDYHTAHTSGHNCTERYHRCMFNIWNTSLVL